MLIHELGEFQWNTLLLTALSTSGTKERVNLGRRRRRGVVRSSAGTWSGNNRYLGLIFTTHGTARVPLFRCGRQSHQEGVLRFVFTAAGTAASPLLHQHAGVKIGITSIRHQKAALGGKEKTLDVIWRKKTMRWRKLTMRGLWFSLTSRCTLFISNLKWAFMNYRSN
jgi:hypothetical protein